MKAFFRNIISSCLGSLLAISVLTFVVFLVVRSYISKPAPNQKGILHIPISGMVTDYSNSGIDLNKFSFAPSGFNLWDLSKTINAASTDKNISAIFIEFENAQLSQQMVSELSPILSKFRAGGKKIYTYSSYYSQNAYLLSTFTDSIFLNPNGGVNLKGYGVYSPFFKDLLDEYNIDVNVYYAGKYKSSTEPYRLMSFSEDNDFQLQQYVNELYEILVAQVASARNLSRERVKEIIKAHKTYDGKFMEANVIVDALKYRDEVISILEDLHDEQKMVEYSSYSLPESDIDAETAIVFAQGEIAWNNSAEQSITPAIYEKIFEEIRENEDIKTVILRLDSPGGSGYASDLIHREVELTRSAGKKVYASLGSYATSGAYYIAAACDSIFATPNTLTGSIGVYLMIPTINRFIEKNLKIKVDTIQSNPNAIAYTPILGLSEVQESGLTEQTDNLYDLFLSKVADGRKMSIAEVHEVAQGRIWTGIDALEKGLVDKLRSLNEVQEEFSSGRPKYIFPRQESSLPMRLLETGADKLAFSQKSEIIMLQRKVTDFQKLIEKPSPLMRIPHNLNVTNQ